MSTSILYASPVRLRFALNATRYGQQSFVCSRCLHQQQVRAPQRLIESTRQTAFLKAFRQNRQRQARDQSSAVSPPLSPHSNSAVSPLETLNSHVGVGSARTSTGSSSWPKTSSQSVAYWLLGSAASVFGIVVFGGLTRLTESGLSITEWRPVTGSLPPRNEEIWEEEFARYRLSPEFKMLNSRMDLEDFKQIYWMEWTHRLWGRVVGLTFFFPTIYFIARRRVSAQMSRRLIGISGLIGFQGFLGWWMVKSGLKDDLFAQGSHPRVSQYRLAAHLGTAFVAYLAMLWNGLSILHENKLLRNPAESMKLLETLRSPQLRTYKRLTLGLSLLVFTTAISGAFVAGLDAGLVYNDFPWMGQGLIPPKRELLDPFYSHTPTQSDLVWRNMLENPVLVQLDHRILATTTFTAVLALWAYSRFSRSMRASLPPQVRKATFGLVHLVTLQAALGITTLWYLVPTPIAAAHQAGALALLSGVLVLGNRLRVSRRTYKLVEEALRASRQSSSQTSVGKVTRL